MNNKVPSMQNFIEKKKSGASSFLHFGKERQTEHVTMRVSVNQKVNYYNIFVFTFLIG